MAVWFIKDLEGDKGDAYNLSKAKRMFIDTESLYRGYFLKALIGEDGIFTLMWVDSRTDIDKIFDGIVETVATQDFALIRQSEIKSKYLSDEN